MLFSDLALARRLEGAEGYACVQFAEARRRLFPGSGAEWIECAGAYAIFDGIDSPVTQSFGLGIFEELSAASLDVIERFFVGHGAPVLHEVSRRSATLGGHGRYAFDHGCDMAMMVAAAGSDSQRNAERKGFRIAYTRTKWQLTADS